MITNLRMEFFQALISTLYGYLDIHPPTSTLQVSCGHQLITFSDPKHRVDTGEVHTLEMIISLTMGQVGAL